ncbi:MAG TPA: hypothetical protein VNS60_00415 [Solirubrobacterales bacterium]|nr:hypothetical protein [Solirubrobacterales bacterium]
MPASAAVEIETPPDHNREAVPIGYAAGHPLTLSLFVLRFHSRHRR